MKALFKPCERCLKTKIPMSGPRAIDAPVCFEVERTLTAESGMDAALAALDCALAERRFALSRLSAPQAILNGLSIEALRADLVPDGPCRWRLTIGVDETLIVESHEEDLQ